MNSPRQGPTRSELLASKMVLPVILAVAACLRLFQLGYEGLWNDELAQVSVAENSFLQVILQAVRHYGNTPLDYIFTHLALQMGRSEDVLRLPSVLWGVLAVPAILKVGETLFDRRVGLYAALLLAFLPIHIHYSREVRFYSLATLLALLSVLFFLKAIEQHTRRAWVAFGIIQVLAFYSHYYLVVITMSEAIWLLRSVRAGRHDLRILRWFLGSAGVSFLLFLPWCIFDFLDGLIGGQGIPNLGLQYGLGFNFPNPITFLTANFFPYARLFEQSIWWVSLAVACALVAPVVAFCLRKTDRKFSSGISLLLLLYLTGVVGVFTLDAVGSWFFANRQILIFTPFLHVAVAATLVKLAQTVGEILSGTRISGACSRRMLEAGGLLGVAIFGIWSLSPGIQSIYSRDIADWRVRREDWRGTGEFLEANLGQNDLVLSPHDSFIRFYAENVSARIVWLPDDPGVVLELARSHERIWILTRDIRLRIYPNMSRFIQQEKLVELSLHPDLRLYVFSSSESSSELLAELLHSGAYTPSTLILTDLIDRAVAEGYGEEVYKGVFGVLNRPDVATVNKASIARRGAEAFMNAQDLSKASTLAFRAVSLHPSNSRSWSLLGHIYTRQNELEEAVYAYEKAAAIDPSDFWAHHLLAGRLAQLGRWQEVLQHEERALRMAPNDDLRLDCLTQIARAYSSLRDNGKACKTLSEAYRVKESQTILTEMGRLECLDPR